MDSHLPAPDPSFDVSDESQLQALFPAPNQASLAKELDHVDTSYAAWIRRSALASS